MELKYDSNFATAVVEQNLLTAEQLAQVRTFQQTCEERFQVSLSLAQVLHLKFPALREKILALELQVLPTPVLAWQGQPDFSPQIHTHLIQQIRRSVAAQSPQRHHQLDNTIQQSAALKRDLAIVGLTFTTPEIIAARGFITWEELWRLCQQYQAWGPWKPQRWQLRPLVPANDQVSSMPDIARLAYHNELISEEEYDQCLSLQRACQEKYGICLKMLQLLHEQFLLDHNLLEALLKLSIQFKYDRIIEHLTRRQQLDGLAGLNTIRKHGWVDAPQLSQLQQLQNEIAQQYQVRIPLGYLLVAKGYLSDEQLATLMPDKPQIDSRELPKLVLDKLRSPSLGDIALASGQVSPQQLTQCIVFQRVCQQEYELPMKLGEIMVIKELCDLGFLKSLLQTQAFLEVRAQAHFDLVKFAPEEEAQLISTLQQEGRLNPAQNAVILQIQAVLASKGLEWSAAKIMVARGLVSREEVMSVLAKRAASCSYLHWPGRDIELGTLAVANHYLCQEEDQVCRALQRQCKEWWDLNIPLEVIYFKKGLLSPSLLQELQGAVVKYKHLKKRMDWLVSLDLSHDEQKGALKRLRDLQVITTEDVKALHVFLQEQGLSLTFLPLLMCRKNFQPWMLADILPAGQPAQFAKLFPARPDPRAHQRPFAHERQIQIPQVQHALLFGQIALRRGFITKDNLKSALRLQQWGWEMGVEKKIGAIMMEVEFMSRVAVERVLQEQKELQAQVEYELPPPAAEEQALIEALTARQLLSEQQINQCRYIQQQLEKMALCQSLRDIIAQRNLLDRKVLDSLAPTSQATGAM